MGEGEDPPPLWNDKMSWLVYQMERGEEGTEHYQFGFILRKRERKQAILQWLGQHLKEEFPEATGNWEIYLAPMEGTPAQVRHYCQKPHDGCECNKCADAQPRLAGWWEHGKVPKKGSTDLMKTMLDAVRDGRSLGSLGRESPAAYRYGKSWDRMRQEELKVMGNTWRDLTVKVFLGDPGTGKTKKAVEDAGGYTNCYILTKMSKGSIWFDGYEGEDTLIIDDFDSGWSIEYRALLRILDGHPLRLPIKGGFLYALFTNVVITCNVPVDRWYPLEKDIRALQRRITETVNFSGLVVPVPVGGGNITGSASTPPTSNGTISNVPFTPLQRQNAFVSGRRAPRFGARDEEVRRILHGERESAGALVSLAGVGRIEGAGGSGESQAFDPISFSISDSEEE